MPGVLPIPAARLIKLSQSHTRPSILFYFPSAFFLIFFWLSTFFCELEERLMGSGLSIKLEASMQTE